MHQDDIAESQQQTREGGAISSARDNALLRIAASALKPATQGRLTLRMPSGRAAVIGSASTNGVDADVTLTSLKPLWRSVRRGPLGFAESYMLGEIETTDLGNLLRYFIDNYPELSDAGRGLFRVRLSDKVVHKMRRNTRAGSRRNIRAHYDLGNAFYDLWLDPGMTYSSGIYRPEEGRLEEAQNEKYRRVIEALGLSPSHDVLEIGCGWGGMAERAARSGARVTAITVSAEQHAYASRRLADAGLSDRAHVEFLDYRDTRGEFDRIVSIEMIEAVGEKHWPEYFSTIAKRLKPGGAAVIQAITINENDFDLYRSRPDFIQRYIFPGGMLPTVSAIATQAAAAGLAFETVERFGHSYARTLVDWRARFLAAWPEIRRLGFDERFRQMWMYYLTYCEVGFERSVCDVGIYRLTKA